MPFLPCSAGVVGDVQGAIQHHFHGHLVLVCTAAPYIPCSCMPAAPGNTNCRLQVEQPVMLAMMPLVRVRSWAPWVDPSTPGTAPTLVSV
jgi:hypothetical protein